METQILSLWEIEIGARFLKQGYVIGFPTETVYGLAVIYDNQKAYDMLMDVKKRPPQKPFTLMCADLTDLEKYAYVNDKIISFLNSYMPGALTVLLPKKDILPSWVTLDSDFIGVRISGFPFVRNLIREVGKPLLVPSANESGQPPLSMFEDVKRVFNHKVRALYQEDAQGELPSTIIKIDNNNVYLLREGAIPFQEIERKWNNENSNRI